MKARAGPPLVISPLGVGQSRTMVKDTNCYTQSDGMCFFSPVLPSELQVPGTCRNFQTTIYQSLYDKAIELAGSYHTFPFVGPKCAPEVQRIIRDCEPANGAVIAPTRIVYRAVTRPFAQFHYPFENEELFKQRFPADFICEGLDQTRGWFYSLLAESTLLFDQPSYRNVLCLGLILDPEGQKMSKSRGNVVAPWDVIDRHGADAFRWYYFTSQQPWSGYRFSVDTVGESVRKFLLTLWNTYSFFVLYANVEQFDHGTHSLEPAQRPALDRWVLSRLQGTIAEVRQKLDSYDTTSAGRAIATFVDDLSNWYVRRSRRRFWRSGGGGRGRDSVAAYLTLHEALVTVAQLLAPFTPFIADEIYRNLDGAEPSVHLCDFPVADEALIDRRARVRHGGRAPHGGAGARRAQPGQGQGAPAAARGRGRRRPARARCDRAARGPGAGRAEREGRLLCGGGGGARLIRGEAELPHAGTALRVAACRRSAKAIEQLDPSGDRGGPRPRRGGDDRDRRHRRSALGSDDLSLVMLPREGYQLERQANYAVALQLDLDDELLREGAAREVVHAIQNARKGAACRSRTAST